MNRRALVRIVAVLALFLLPLSARANCTSPAGVDGQTVYNTDYHCFQYCNGVHWMSYGTVSGGGGGGCSSPAGVEKQLIYNYASHVLQYCNGTNWVAQGVVAGPAWTAQTAAEAMVWTAVAYGNGLFVAVAGSAAHSVMTSPDGVTWTAQTAAAEPVGHPSPTATACSSRWRSVDASDDFAGRRHLDGADGGGERTPGTPSPTATACSSRWRTTARTV